MLTDKQTELIAQLVMTWSEHPEWRLGQLIENAQRAMGDRGSTFSVRDNVIEQGLRKLAQV